LDLNPYVVFLPADDKTEILGAIFGSKAVVDILKFSLHQGISNKIYQKNLIKELNYSNKTVIGNLKTLTRLGILQEQMEKQEINGRTVWLKVYQLSDIGKWFALLLAEEKELSHDEKAEIFTNIFRTYVRWAKELSQDLNVDKKMLEKVFIEEMR
jgi:hypothetical protein